MKEAELTHPHLRVVQAWIPGGLPEVAWNVDGYAYQGRSIAEPKIPHLRRGVYSTFRVNDGEFRVQFNDRTETK